MALTFIINISNIWLLMWILTSPGSFRPAAADPGAAIFAGLLAAAPRGEVQRPSSDRDAAHAEEGAEGDEAPCGQAVKNREKKIHGKMLGEENLDPI